MWFHDSSDRLDSLVRILLHYGKSDSFNKDSTLLMTKVARRLQLAKNSLGERPECERL